MASRATLMFVLVLILPVSCSLAQTRGGRAINWAAVFNTTRLTAGILRVPYKELFASMDGNNIVATTGDQQATGWANLVVYKLRGDFSLNYMVTVSQLTNTEVPVSAAIHVGPAGSNGPEIMRFERANWRRFNPNAKRLVTRTTQGNNYMLSGTYSATSEDKIISGETVKQLILAILQDPRQFYIVVKTPAYPLGAIRGQLRVSSK
ncbi:hypothetical protein CLOM_g6188 [Closterium sp. NIES-68]|nr:hypothetical protein CLOM_g20541 [Closterium sp. NIES-68]GJP46949.1 hypothetical protein CLOM_g6188 [Closterium sp. NIES-68]GJP67076.1 hypothetical protein CLOP_g23947 [Closterium sp. NIES-67]GJP82621.1 hypothetical protein CLOP_g12858 [Closterium sp. NIES-67]